MSSQEPPVPEYRCPGEAHPISREIHLGRLARFYPACQRCVHRDDVGALSARQIRQWTEIRNRAIRPSRFDTEGARGSFNELSPEVARRMTIAFVVAIGSDAAADATRTPVIAIGGDGRPQTAQHIATVSEAIRWTGCEAVDLGSVTSPCMAMAVKHLGADGGIMVGNPDGEPSTLGVKFWSGAAEPLSHGKLLTRIEQLADECPDRPTRTYGPLRRFGAEKVYLAGLLPHYHALRPLRFVVRSTCAPWVGYLQRLIESVACRMLPCHEGVDRLGEQVVAEKAHFGLHVGDDGEQCGLMDEQGRPVPCERLMMLLARDVVADALAGDAMIILENACSPLLMRQIESIGGLVISGGTRRAEMARTMRENRAVLGGGPSGRYWYAADNLPLPDALRTLTRLLVLLSQSDRPLSKVLDEEAPVE